MIVDIAKIRRENMRRLIREHDGPKAFAERIGLANSFVVQMAGPNPTREVSEKTARKVENTLDLPAGWMDTPAEAIEIAPVNVSLVSEVIRLVGQSCEEAGVKLSHAKFADLVTLVYTTAADAGGVPRVDFIKKMIHLLK